MKLIGVTGAQIDAALAEVNIKYQGNIDFYTREYKHTRRDGREEWDIVLGVVDGRGPGSARAVRLWNPYVNRYNGGKRTGRGCWHVYGDFFDALGKLAPEAEMIGRPGNWNAPEKNRRCLVREHGWVNPYICNNYDGEYASALCDCEEEMA